MNIVPLNDQVCVVQVDEEELSPGGLVIAKMGGRPIARGAVMAVGPGRTLDTGELKPPKIKVGDHVLYPNGCGWSTRLEGVTYEFVKEESICCVLQDPPPMRKPNDWLREPPPETLPQ